MNAGYRTHHQVQSSKFKVQCFLLSNMCHTVVELCQLATVPAVGGTYQVAGDALKLVDVVAAALRTNLQVGIGILVAAVQAAVAVVVY